MNALFFMAHPDDAEISFGGLVLHLLDHGHKVKILAGTNGDAGCGRIDRAEAARIRAREAAEAARYLGAELEILPNHDGYLEPTLANRETLVSRLREWRTDLLVTHIPFDYHPDHRAVARLAMDAGFMTLIPGFCQDVEPLPDIPVILQLQHGDIQCHHHDLPCDWALDLEPYKRRKAKAISLHRNQMLAPEEYDLPEEEIISRIINRKLKENKRHAESCRGFLKTFFGPERAAAVQYAECYTLSPFGRAMTQEALRAFLPPSV